MTKEKANMIANDFFKDMNPTLWNGEGNKPSTFDERIWEYELSKDDYLDISFYYDFFGAEWFHCCEIVDKQSDEMTAMLSGCGINSILNLVDTIMNICKNYE